MAEAWNPWLGGRTGRAWAAALELLGESGWRGAPTLVEAMARAGPVKATTAENLLRQGARWGALQERRTGGARSIARRLYRISASAPPELLRPAAARASA